MNCLLCNNKLLKYRNFYFCDHPFDLTSATAIDFTLPKVEQKHYLSYSDNRGEFIHEQIIIDRYLLRNFCSENGTEKSICIIALDKRRRDNLILKIEDMYFSDEQIKSLTVDKIKKYILLA